MGQVYGWGLRRWAAGLLVGLACGAMAPAGAQSVVRQEQATPASIADVTRSYVVQFYPLWFSYYQTQRANNRLIGPDRISPLYQTVVAINNDTLYASTLVNLSKEPVILTVPKTKATYSTLLLDPYGDIIDSGIPAETPGVYGLVGPAYEGKLPAGITPLYLPLDYMILIFRTDKFASDGKSMIPAAQTFRKSLKLQTLSDYKKDPTAGAAAIVPEIFFAKPFKTAADTLTTTAPITFLSQLQKAVAAPNTPPLSASAKALSDRFDRLFGDGTFTSDSKKLPFVQGTKAAHNLILNNYLNHRGSTNWINFTNIGDWNGAWLDRSSIAEFIQYGNAHSTAAYFHTFRDGMGLPLDGTNKRGYMLHFAKDQIPEAKRFWSLTVYTPESIELVKNDARKYEVASYSPGLHYNRDGSLTILFTPKQPTAVPAANWVPIPAGPFNVMLRVYGPEGDVLDNRYLPPAIDQRPPQP